MPGPTPTPSASLLGSLRHPGKLALSIIFMIMLIDVMGMTLLIPVSPYIVQEFSAQALSVTLLSVIYAAAQFLAAPFLGKLSDRTGRRPVLLVCLGGALIGYLVFGLGGTLWVLFLSRLVAGITGGSISTASAYIADVSQPEDLSRNFGLIGLAWGVGLVLGPALGGLLGQFGLRLPAFCAAAFCFANLVLSFVSLPESLPPTRRVRQALRPADFNSLASIGDMARIAGLGSLLVVLVLFNFGFNGMNSTESLFFIARFDAQPWQIGLMTVLIGAALALVQAFVVQRAVLRFGDVPVCIASLAAMALAVVVIVLTPVFTLVFPVVVLRSAASALVFPTLTTLTARRVEPDEVGGLMGVTTALGSLTGILGPILAGVLYDQVHPAAPYWMAAGFFVAAAGLLLHLTRAPRPAAM